jgi:hypothetical protein
MTDPAVRHLAARRDLSNIPHIVDHLLKEAAEHPPASMERLDRIKALRKLFALRNRLRREEDDAFKQLMRELPPEPIPSVADIWSDPSGTPSVDGTSAQIDTGAQRRLSEYEAEKAAYWGSAERLLERLLSKTRWQRASPADH